MAGITNERPNELEMLARCPDPVDILATNLAGDKSANAARRNWFRVDMIYIGIVFCSPFGIISFKRYFLSILNLSGRKPPTWIKNTHKKRPSQWNEQWNLGFPKISDNSLSETETRQRDFKRTESSRCRLSVWASINRLASAVSSASVATRLDGVDREFEFNLSGKGIEGTKCKCATCVPMVLFLWFERNTF